jgi:hypothetical protein
MASLSYVCRYGPHDPDMQRKTVDGVALSTVTTAKSKHLRASSSPP